MATRPTESSLVNDHGLLAKPLHIQRLEKALQLGPFLNHVENVFKQTSDIEDSESDFEPPDLKSLNGTYNVPPERTDPLRLYNFSKVKKERKWLKNVLLSDSSDSAENTDNSLGEHDLQEMLKLHKLQKAARKEYQENSEHLKQYQYMSVGLLSNYDKYPEHQMSSSPGIKIKKAEKKNKMKRPKIEKDLYEDGIQDTFDAIMPEEKIKREKPHQGKRKATGNEASMTMKRKRLWTALAKKEISRAQKQRTAARKDVLAIKKKLAQACLRECRKSALLSQKTMKENPSKARRLTKEMLFYWKRYEKVEKEHRKKAEKEAQEQLRINMELLEAKRQQRKLNFLITQTELYAHFMSHKMDGAQPDSILKSLNEEIEDMGPLQNHPSLQDNYDCEFMKALALKNVETAFQSQQSKVDQFDQDMPIQKKQAEEQELASDLPQPKMFVGKLKSYQLKGMTWLYNLYDKGINGILADEMGLGKTVQTIAFLTTLVERQGIWGPFLIVAPASTLHNWQQEFTKFVPLLKVLPYWGNTCDRKILRKFWSQKDLHTKDASFHVLITSYQLIIQDVKYFQRIKWQYLVLDEAQAIKCSSSSRWNVLLNFNCRNRLLLTGTPIQNNMAELWALLHFIMPTLFDSHAEFDEWFSKEIENHTDKNSINERHLSRLHMILKPFMLRRIKKDVENELTDKIEILKYCCQSRRQKELYQALRTKICIKDLLQNPSSTPNQSSSLMNLVMQFRKVCNHPDLFERREVKSPFYIELKTLHWPKLIYDFHLNNQTAHFFNLLFLPRYIYSSIFYSPGSCTFSFTRLLGLSPSQVYKIALGGPLVKLQTLYECQMQRKRKRHSLIDDYSSPQLPDNLLFISPLAGGIYAFLTHKVFSQKMALKDKVIPDDGIKASCFECMPTPLPKFLYGATAGVFPRVLAPPRTIYSSSFAWRLNQDHFHPPGRTFFLYGPSPKNPLDWNPQSPSGLLDSTPPNGWTSIYLPDRETLVTDSGKLQVLDSLLKELKTNNHRVLIYSQMTRMIDILEEYMIYRKHTYIRLDGSSKISERRDMVANFQSRSDIFVFLLSTRAGGLGINLTAADTVIFYDSDWNPTVDQQAMDRAHRLGQTKQVTVYRLVCKGTVEERILQRARQKSQIQQMVISGGTFKPETLKPTEVVSLLLDEEELERTLWNQQIQQSLARNKKRKLKASSVGGATSDQPFNKKMKMEENETKYSTQLSQQMPVIDTTGDDSNSSSSDGPLVVDDTISTTSQSSKNSIQDKNFSGRRGRGRPRGSGKRGARSTVLTTAAAEMAAAKAGTSAGFAAYGYVIPGVQPSTPLSSSLGSSPLSKPQYSRGTRHKKTNPRPPASAAKTTSSSEPSTTHSQTGGQQSFTPRPFGFYVQQPSSLT